MGKSLLIILFVIMISPLSSQTLTGAFYASEDSAIFALVQQWAEEVGQKAGITFLIESIPFDRAKQRLLSGLIDADISRSKYAYGDDDRVIYTSHPSFRTPFVIYSKLDSIDSQNIESFKKLSLVTTRSNFAVNDWIEKNQLYDIIYVDSIEIALRMIEMNRADYYVGPYVYLKVLGLNPEFSGIKVISPPVFILLTYIVLNNKYKDLEPAISAAMKQMVESGRTAEIFGVR
jgi:polar amino acid transport system substrate-binding protein